MKTVLSIALALSSFGVQGAEVACVVPDRYKIEVSDIERMARLEISRSMGLAAALNMRSAEDRGIISSLFASGFTSIEDPARVIGNYQCRTIKLGGDPAGIVYGWFSCKIFPEAAVLIIHKSTGSQRFFGLLDMAGNGMAYRGAQYYGYEAQSKFYGEDVSRNQVGCLSALDASMNHFVLEMPTPERESVHDVIELVRVN